eukprot:Platyproteum_vivax@DN4549_c0_g1_i2.p1
MLEYNGSAVVAMTGHNCVAIAADKRLGQNLHAVSTDFQKIFPCTERCFVGLAGLATDVQTVSNLLRFRINLYQLREERAMTAEVLSHLVGSMLYERRFAPWFLSPVVAGLDKNNQPVITSYDFIGASSQPKDFVVTGTSSEELFGVCESFYRPNMEPDELFETLAQCLLSACDRDALTGFGGVVHVITPTQVITRHIKGRSD